MPNWVLAGLAAAARALALVLAPQFGLLFGSQVDVGVAPLPLQFCWFGSQLGFAFAPPVHV